MNNEGFMGVMELINRYGLAFFISAVFLYGIIEAMKIGFAYLKGKTGQKHHEEIAKKKNEADLKIQLLLNRALSEADAQRIIVAEFHNGKHNFSGLPYVSFGVNYEADKRGFFPVAPQMRNIPTSLWASLLDRLRKEPYLILNTNSPVKDFSAMPYAFMEIHGVTEAIYVMIHDVHEQILGFISMQKNEGITNNDALIVNGLADQIGALLGILTR